MKIYILLLSSLLSSAAFAKTEAPVPASTPVPESSKLEVKLDDKTAFTLYGFVKASTIAADHAVESYGRPNAGAYTAAGNPALSAHPSRGNSTFQVNQSRLGLKAATAENVNGLLEFDFVDFSKASPTVGSVVRLRRATVNFKNNDGWTFNVGQDWDLFSPLTPYTYDLIGHYFGSGDLGFMRIQGQALKKSGNWEHAFAIGFPAPNVQPANANNEYTMTPTFAWRETLTQDKNTYGFAAIVGHTEDSNTKKSLTPYALNLFFKGEYEKTTINSELYYGQNIENIGLYGLGYSPTNSQKLEEMGGFITVRQKLENHHGIYGGLGYARVSNSSGIVPSYHNTAGPGTAVSDVTAAVGQGYGIAQNGTARLGYEYAYSPRLNLFAETAFLYTQHILAAADKGRLPSYVHAQVLELGLKLDF